MGSVVPAHAVVMCSPGGGAEGGGLHVWGQVWWAACCEGRLVGLFCPWPWRPWGGSGGRVVLTSQGQTLSHCAPVREATPISEWHLGERLGCAGCRALPAPPFLCASPLLALGLP